MENDTPMKTTGAATCLTIMIIIFTLTNVPSPATEAGEPSPVVAHGAAPTLCAEGFGFSEGPVSDAEGNVWFSDYADDVIYRWSVSGSLERVWDDIGGPIGLAFDENGILYVCAARAHRIRTVAPDGTATDLPDRFNGKLFNSPNDVWIDPAGGVYFTDPRFSPLPEEVEQDGFHIYRILPGGEIIRAADDLNRPNGITGSPDGRTVYVTDTPDDVTYAYTVRGDGALGDRRVFAEEGYDGLTVDEAGNVYITMQTSVEVYSPDGDRIESIPFPDKPTNVCFGGPDRTTLFVTARASLYSLRMQVKGVR